MGRNGHVGLYIESPVFLECVSRRSPGLRWDRHALRHNAQRSPLFGGSNIYSLRLYEATWLFSLSLLPSSPSPVLHSAYLPPLPKRTSVWRGNLRANALHAPQKAPTTEEKADGSARRGDPQAAGGWGLYGTGPWGLGKSRGIRVSGHLCRIRCPELRSLGHSAAHPDQTLLGRASLLETDLGRPRLLLRNFGEKCRGP